MGFIAHILRCLLWRRPTPQASIQDPEPIIEDDAPELGPDIDFNDHLDTLDNDAFDLWRDWLEVCYELDPTKHCINNDNRNNNNAS